MKRSVLAAALLAATVVIPAAATAQGVPGGIERGSREGERAAGPVGAIVGGAVGGVVGGVAGVLGVDQRPRFHSYVVERHHPSYTYRGDLRVGADLPEDGVTYYDVPPGVRCSGLPLYGGQWSDRLGRSANAPNRRNRRMKRTASRRSPRLAPARR